MRTRSITAWPRTILIAFGILGLIALGCNKSGGAGACQSTPRPSTGTVFCYDDWDESECEDYDDQMVNGVDWFHHSGQTCAERGCGTPTC